MAKTLSGPGGCWLWTGRLDRNGYGRITHEGKSREAYRVAYEEFVGPIPVGLHLDHLCRVRRCINPQHLEPVPPIVNNLRGDTFGGINSRKTECIHGHPYTPENTGYQARGRSRYCKTCRRISNNANKNRYRKTAKAARQSGATR